MAKRVMDRHAADNKYLHRDFHVSGDTGLAYVGGRYGDEGVREYLERFTRAWYGPLIAEASAKGLVALAAHIEKTYAAEEAADVLHIQQTETALCVNVDFCPAVAYMKSAGHTPSRWYVELTRTVNRVIAEDAGLGFEMISYDEETGKAAYRFFIGSAKGADKGGR